MTSDDVKPATIFGWTGAVMGAIGVVVLGFVGIIVLCIFIFGGIGRMNARHNASNRVKISNIEIRNQAQRITITRQQAQIRFEQSVGVRRAQDEIARTLTPLYVQFEMIEALKSTPASVVYIPTGSNGLPLVTTVAQPPKR